MAELDTVSTITETGASEGANGNEAGSNGVAGDQGSASTGVQLPGWTAGLSKEQKEALTVQKVTLPEKFTDFWNQHAQLEANLKKAVVVPGKDAPKETWAAYRKAIGVPDSIDGYAFDRPQLPEGMRYNEDFEKWARAQFHELGVPAETAKEILNRYIALLLNGFKSLSEQRTRAAAEAESKKRAEFANGEAVLREQWGGAYNERVAGVKQMLREGKVIPSKWVEKITKAGLDNDPDTLFVLDQMRRYTREDRKIGLDGEVHDVGVDENVDPKTGRRYIKHKRTLQRESE